MAIINTAQIAITAKKIFLSFGLAGFKSICFFNQFIRSLSSKNYTTMWVLLLFYGVPGSIVELVERIRLKI